MSFVLTRTCHHAIILVVQNGLINLNLPKGEFYMECDIDLKLPSSINDLLPPETDIKSRPLQYSSDPEWKPTFTYYLSTKLLKYLVKQNAKFRLKMYSTYCPETPYHEFEILLSDAKYLQETGSTTKTQPHLSQQLKQHKLVTRKCNLELRCGLFVVRMPEKRQGTSEYANNSCNRVEPQNQLDYATSTLYSIPAPPFYPSDSEASLMSHQTARFSVISQSSAASSAPPSYRQIGDGHEPYVLYFNLASTNFANNMSSAAAENNDDLRPTPATLIFRYTLLDQVVNVAFQHGKPASNPRTQFLVHGHHKDILEWLNHHPKLRVAIYLRDKSVQEELEVGYSMVSLTNMAMKHIHPDKVSFQEALSNRNVPIYDRKNRLVLQSKSSIASLNLQTGLFPNWVHNEAEPFGTRSSVDHADLHHWKPKISNQRRDNYHIDQLYSCFDPNPTSSTSHDDGKQAYCKSTDRQWNNNTECGTALQANRPPSRSTISRCQRTYTCLR